MDGLRVCSCFDKDWREEETLRWQGPGFFKDHFPFLCEALHTFARVGELRRGGERAHAHFLVGRIADANGGEQFDKIVSYILQNPI